MSDNIDFGINANGANVAARGLQRVGDSARKLNQDISGLKGAAGVFNRVGSAAKGLAGKLNILSGAAKTAQASFVPLLAIFAGVRAIQGVASLISDSNEAFNTQAEAARGATEAQKQYAAQMQTSLGIGDEMSLGIMQQARALGIAEDQIAEATKAAIGLSAATGEGTGEALKKVNRLLQGSTDGFNELIPSLRDMTSEQEKVAAINALVTRGLDKQAQTMEGLQGIQTRASNSLGDLAEVFGEILAPMRAVVSQGVAVFAEAMQDVLAPAAEFARSALANLPAVLERVKTVVIGAVTAIEVYYTNLPTIFELVSTKIQLTWLQLSEGAKYYFTSAIPQYLTWFADNWQNLLFDAANAAATVVSNYFQRQVALFQLGFRAALDLGEWFAENLPKVLMNLGNQALDVLAGAMDKISEVFTAAWDYITSYFVNGGGDVASSLSENLAGVVDASVAVLAEPPGTLQSYATEFGEIMSRNLLDGFKSSVTPLPEVLGRQITEGEQSLQNRLGELGQGLADQFTDKFGRRMAAIPSMVGGAVDDANSKLGDLAGAAALASGAGAGSASELQATQGRLLTRGRSDDPNAAIADNTKATVAELQKIRTMQERQGNQGQQVIRVETTEVDL